MSKDISRSYQLVDRNFSWQCVLSCTPQISYIECDLCLWPTTFVFCFLHRSVGSGGLVAYDCHLVHPLNCFPLFSGPHSGLLRHCPCCVAATLNFPFCQTRKDMFWRVCPCCKSLYVLVCPWILAKHSQHPQTSRLWELGSSWLESRCGPLCLPLFSAMLRLLHRLASSGGRSLVSGRANLSLALQLTPARNPCDITGTCLM